MVVSRQGNTTRAAFEAFGGGGSISAILRRQSASETCGPETKVPLTLVLYQPDSTPSQSDSSVLTWRGDRFCMRCSFGSARDFASNAGGGMRLLGEQPLVQLSPESRVKSANTAATRSR